MSTKNTASFTEEIQQTTEMFIDEDLSLWFI
jgi:hypothetical protein